MTAEKRILRSLPDFEGATILKEATNLGRAANPLISLIFDEESKIAYELAVLASSGEHMTEHAARSISV